MDPFTSVSNITNVDTIDSMSKLLELAIALRPDYWGKYIGNLLEISLNLIKDKNLLFSGLLRCINKATVPETALLDIIPRKVCKIAVYKIVYNNLTREMRKSGLKIGTERFLFVRLTNAGNQEYLITHPFYENGDNDFSEKIKSIVLSNIGTIRQQLNVDPTSDIETIYNAWMGPSIYECSYCRSENAYARCATCGVSYYCSKEHQQLDWRIHKEICYTLRCHKLSLSYLATIKHPLT